jgi:effector-binding domain-containing protein
MSKEKLIALFPEASFGAALNCIGIAQALREQGARPVFICHEISPEAVMEANEKGTATVEVVWPVSGTVKGTKEMKVFELPGGKMAHTIHYGPYESCESTYLELFAWIKEKGLRISGPIREVYPNDPREVPPEKIITEIFVPVS